MYSCVLSAALVGGDVEVVRVEAHVGGTERVIKLSGLPDTALREARDRVRAAVRASGIEFPHRGLIINLAPAGLRKSGSEYDLPIALAILAADRQIPSVDRVVVVGELSLDGKIRPGGGSLGAAVLSSRLGIPCLVAPGNATGVATVPGSEVYPVATLNEAVSLVASGVAGEPARPDLVEMSGASTADLGDVRGQGLARRALEIAAAGSHHLLLHGPPGGGKTMLAARLPSILPRLDEPKAIESALIRAGAGLGGSVSRVPPFRAPHHTATRAALVGGGTGTPTPGEISLAHNGVLFLDELAEFPRAHLDALRQPLEEGRVVISRQGAATRFPARFQLVGATNPCPCGYWGDRRRPCSCTGTSRERYRHRLSGPLLDRFDLSVEVRRVDAGDFDAPTGESSAQVASRVAEAREAQSARGGVNGIIPDRLLQKLPIDGEARAMLIDSLERGVITARGLGKVRRVAQTIADLDGTDVGPAAVAEALALRTTW